MAYQLVILPCSEFVTKVQCALQYYGIEHSKLTVATRGERSKYLPKPHLVPVIKSPDGVVVFDSMEIFNWLNENEPKCKGKLYPSTCDRKEMEEVEKLTEAVCSHRAHFTTKRTFWEKSRGGKIRELLKGQNCFVRCFYTADKLFSKDERQISRMLERIGYKGIDDENPTLGFQKTMKIFESILLSKSGDFLFGEEPSAPDFALFGHLVNILPPGYFGFLPPMFDDLSVLCDPDTSKPFELLQNWHTEMKKLTKFDSYEWANTPLLANLEQLHGIPDLKEVWEAQDLIADDTKHGNRSQKGTDWDAMISKYTTTKQ
eukprot:g10580.t1